MQPQICGYNYFGLPFKKISIKGSGSAALQAFS
jgi:hypothetical protein